MLGVFHHWWLPILSAVIWWGMLIALLSCWAAEGHPHYAWMRHDDQYILYISDIAAGKLQPVFISCSAAQGVLFILSLAAEMYLRNNGRLRPNHRKYGQVCLGCAIGFAVVGQLGILFVSIFNTREFHDAHISLLVIFIVFVGISALFSVAEYAALDRDYTHKRHMIVGLWLKVGWFIVEFIIAVAFVSSQHSHVNTPAVLEWTVSFVYPFYQLIMAWDLWPAYNKKKGHYPRYNEMYPADPESMMAGGAPIVSSMQMSEPPSYEPMQDMNVAVGATYKSPFGAR